MAFPQLTLADWIATAAAGLGILLVWLKVRSRAAYLFKRARCYIARTGHPRREPEDTLLLPDGSPAPDNATLVRAAVARGAAN